MIGSLGDIIFYASDLNVFSLKKELSRSRKAKITQHEPIYGIGKVRQQGRELMEVSLSIELIAGLTKAPSLHLQMLKDFMELGRYAPRHWRVSISNNWDRRNTVAFQCCNRRV